MKDLAGVTRRRCACRVLTLYRSSNFRFGIFAKRVVHACGNHRKKQVGCVVSSVEFEGEVDKSAEIELNSKREREDENLVAAIVYSTCARGSQEQAKNLVVTSSVGVVPYCWRWPCAKRRWPNFFSPESYLEIVVIWAKSAIVSTSGA